MMESFVIDTHGIPAKTQSPQSRVPVSLNMGQYRRTLLAKYDAAGSSPEMEAWWSNADRLSPRSSANPAVREKIRTRARYECFESGSIANGIIEALTNAVIGCGPTLQVNTGDKGIDDLIEKEFSAWARETRFSNCLRTMFPAKIVDGEAFAEKVRNPTLTSPVKFQLRLSECDLWQNPRLEALRGDREDDGIVYDNWGNPIRYKRLRRHPGDDTFSLDAEAVDLIPAGYVIHWFKASRPGQRRGVSEFASSLRPLAELRRYQMAVQAAAETAANHAGVMFSTASAFSEDPDTIDEGDEFMNVPTGRNGLLTLPQGWDMKQLRAEQPTTQYIEFVEERISAATRPFQMPLNVAIGSSRNHNFASSKVDKQGFTRANNPRRKDCEDVVCTPVFNWWMFEALRIPEYMPLIPDQIEHSWQWPVDEPVDAVAQAKADEIYFNIGWLTDERFCKQRGLDVDEMRAQWKRQTEAREDAGENFPQPGISTSESLMPEQPEPDQEDETQEQEAEDE